MKSVLIVNPFGIGDALFTMVLVENLRKTHPNIKIGFVANERTAELVQLNSSIDRTFIYHKDHLRKLLKTNPRLFFIELKALLSTIKQERYDTVFDLSLNREYSFFMMLLGIKKRVGLDYKNRGIFLTHKKKLTGYQDQHVIDTQLSLLSFVGIEPTKNLKIPLRIDTHKGLKGHPKILAIAPGGGKSWGQNARFKQWDLDRFATLANLLKDKNYHFVLLGDKSEERLLKDLKQKIQAPSTIFSEAPFAELVALLVQSEALISNDQGLMHLANAAGVKTVTVFGPVDPVAYGPYHKLVVSRVVTADVPCRPCYKNFNFPVCAWDRRCLTQISPEDVLRELSQII